MKTHASKRWSLVGAATFVVSACSGSSGNTTVNGGNGDHVGRSCTAANQCYPGIEAGALTGAVTCLTQGIPSGYCTHTCTTDADCCATPGACITGFKEVCAAYESTGTMYCFLSCESADIGAAPDAGTTDPNTFCSTWACSGFTCRSTGGGSANRKFCGP